MPKRTYKLGDTASKSKVISLADIESFAHTTGDMNPVHLDDAFARETRFNSRIAHGLLSAGLISAVLGTQLPGPGSIYLSQSLKFLRPVRPGDTITAEVVVTGWRPEKSIINLDTRCRNQDGEEVLTGEAVLLVEDA